MIMATRKNKVLQVSIPAADMARISSTNLKIAITSLYLQSLSALAATVHIMFLMQAAKQP